MTCRVRPKVLLFTALLAGVSGCARAPASSSPTPAPAEASGAESTSAGLPVSDGESLVAAEQDFALALDAGASCDMLAVLRDRVCGLAERVCTLAGESPDDTTMRAQCEDGAARCLSATEGVRNRCGP